MLTRLAFYKNTGALLSASEIAYYNSADRVVSDEFKHLIKISQEAIDKELNDEIKSIQEYEEKSASLRRAIDEAEAARNEAERVQNEIKIVNAKLMKENKGAREYNLKMEELKANNDLKMKSLTIVMSVIFLPLIIMILLPAIIDGYQVTETIVTSFFTLAGIMIGTFLKDLLTPKSINKTMANE